MTNNHFSLKTLLLAGMLSLSLATPVLAQTAAKPAPAPSAAGTTLAGEDKTVATVNGYEIKTSEVRMAFDDVIGQLPNMPAKLRFPFVVEFLIERHLIAQVAAKEGFSNSDDYKRRLAAYQAKALRDTYLVEKIAPSITEEEIKTEYNIEATKVQQTERVRARHILVASQKEADDVEGKLKAGAKFEDLAKQYSLDGSKDYGGDLGYFTAPEMVKEFSDAAFALKVGETSVPVKSSFGWHVIKLEDRKMGSAPPYDQMKEPLRNFLVRKKVQEMLQALQGSAKVDILDPDLKKAQAEAQAQNKNQPQSLDAIDDSGKGDLSLPDPAAPAPKKK